MGFSSDRELSRMPVYDRRGLSTRLGQCAARIQTQRTSAEGENLKQAADNSNVLEEMDHLILV